MSTLARLLAAPQQSFFLFGPRGTGKTTWVLDAYPDAHRIDLLDEALYQSYLAQPELLADELRRAVAGSWVVIDEVARLPVLLHQVHRFIQDRNLRFALLASSARKLKREGVNLLAGRAVRRDMHQFMPAELGRDFSLDAALTYGTVPVVWTSPSRSDALAAYARMYLREEIQAEAAVRNLPSFARFLPVAALFHAQVLNASGLARDAGVARTTVLGHLDVLEDTLVAFRLPAFEGRLRVRERRHPKLYLFDAGVVRALRGVPTAEPSREELGPLFEGWVASVLRAYRDYRGLFDEWWYWAPLDARTTEVDFLLRRGDRYIAIEAKMGRANSPSDFAGLRAIADLKGLVRRLLVCAVARPRVTEDGIEVLPADSFAAMVDDERLWVRPARGSRKRR